MITTQDAPWSIRSADLPTVWGLNPIQLHDRFWAARGVQVVRQGEPSEIVDGAELFLLTESHTLIIFKLARLVDTLSWLKPDVLYVRLHNGRDSGYREQVITGPDNRFVRFNRIYGGEGTRLARVALTPDRRLAQLWQQSTDPRAGWRSIREEVPHAHRSAASIAGSIYDRTAGAEVMQFLRELMQGWRQPDSTITRARQSNQTTWADNSARIEDGATLVGPVWVGAGRHVRPEATIVGPQVLWDDPSARPPVESLQWDQIEPTASFTRQVAPKRRTSFSVATKRLFDVLFALLALALTLPLYPFIMLAIWLEDGRPFFFVHRRETRGGREFGCIKFRSMRRDADKIKEELARKNQADGPQFFIENDPRMTRVGKFIRKTYLDELPQFINVLLGDMAVVGPRPSPFKENQFSPAWREARLSVRPGITGLWQVKRTRRQGMDFQEWIKYDIQYVESVSWGMDLKIIVDTLKLVIRGILRS
jgi:lipopolysaccharide/colanic/teichoic acid biosynthesis glycosyltransferase